MSFITIINKTVVAKRRATFFTVARGIARRAVAGSASSLSSGSDCCGVPTLENLAA